MYARMDFDPAEGNENELFGVDFVYDLAQLSLNEQLVSTAFGIGVISGTDTTPSSHLTGSPYVMQNPYNLNNLVTLAVQRVQNLLPGVVYWLEATAVTNNGNTLSLWARIPVTSAPDIVWNRGSRN